MKACKNFVLKSSKFFKCRKLFCDHTARHRCKLSADCMILCYVKRVTKSLCQKPWTTKVNMLLLRVLVVMNIRGENEIQCNMKKSEMTSLRYHSYFSVFNSVSQKGGDFANICNLHSLGDGARARATNGLIPETNDAPAWMEYIYLCSSQSNIPFYGKNIPFC